MPALTTEDTLDMLGLAGSGHLSSADAPEDEYTARTVQALADGRPIYVQALADELKGKVLQDLTQIVARVGGVLQIGMWTNIV